MTVYVGLLRAVNVGGSTQLRMPALSALLTRNGFEEVRTWLQSGNVVLRSTESDADRLEQSLEGLIAQGPGLSTDIFVRTSSQWREIVQQNPFKFAAETDPAHLVVTVLKRAPTRDEWEGLRSTIRGTERVQGSGRQAYIVYPDGIGRSRLTGALVEKKLGTRGTSRNWNTVLKLNQLASS